VAARENGPTHKSLSLSLSLSPTQTLVTPYCKRIRPGRRTTRRPWFPLTVSPLCVLSRADPSGLGHAATIYSSVQGPPGVETPTDGKAYLVEWDSDDSSDDDDDDTSSKLNVGIAIKEAPSLFSSPHCLMAKGDAKVKIITNLNDIDDDDVEDDGYSYAQRKRKV
jgi:hypothetical protein